MAGDCAGTCSSSRQASHVPTCPMSTKATTAALVVLCLSQISLCTRQPVSSLPSIKANTDNPRFSKPIENATTVLGRSAILECSVENLGPYNKVAWLKMDSSNSEPTVLTIGTQTLFGGKKYKVTQNGDRQWFLHIKHVRVSDRGNYMCQVNAKNMISQVGFLDVQVPPILIEDRTSSDTTVDEHQKAVLKCSVKGYPRPKISWRREDGNSINLGLFGGKKYSAQSFDGNQLNLTQVTREDMGAYLCIASNGVPPSLSKRILLHVNFRPKIRVKNQLISARVGASVELICMCEAYPRPMVTWITPSGLPVVSGSSANAPVISNQTNAGSPLAKYEVEEERQNYKTTMRLKIHSLSEQDFGSFKCVAKNTLGEKEGLIRVYETQSKQLKNALSIHRQNHVKANSLKSRKSLRKKQSQQSVQLGDSDESFDREEEVDDDDFEEESFGDNNEGLFGVQSLTGGCSGLTESGITVLLVIGTNLAINRISIGVWVV